MERVKSFIKAIILASFATYFIKIQYTNEISKYINPKYNLMSILAAIAFVIFFFAQLFRIWETKQEADYCSCCGHDHHHGQSKLKKGLSYFVLVFPLVTGFTFAPAILDSTIAANKGTLLKPSMTPSNDNNALPPGVESHTEVIPNENYFSKIEYEKRMADIDKVPLLDLRKDIFSSYYEAIETDPEQFIGRKIKLEGFVYKEEGLSNNQLVVSRFMITHCIADASVIGLLVEMNGAESVQEDTWLQITGTLDVTNYNGYTLPIIKADKLENKDYPEDPYVFPALIQLVE